jgi:hypothetical protein
MKKIKAVEIVLFVCLLGSCFIVPRFLTAQLLSGITRQIKNPNEKMISDLMKKYDLPSRRLPTWGSEPVFPEGGWFEQLIRVGLVGLTVLYAFRVAKKVDRESSSPISDNKGS